MLRAATTMYFFLIYETEFVLVLVVLEKFCLAHGLRQLIRDVKSDVRTLNFRSDVTNPPPGKTQNDVRGRSL